MLIIFPLLSFISNICHPSYAGVPYQFCGATLWFLLVITVPFFISFAYAIFAFPDESFAYVNPPNVKYNPSSALTIFAVFILYKLLFFNSFISSSVHSPASYCTKPVAA